MKGVSDIIAIILILLITISLAGLAYLWFTGIFEQITGGVGNQTEWQQKVMGTKFSIDAAVGYQSENKVGVVIRNDGTYVIDLSKLAIYVNNIFYANKEGLGNTLAQGNIVNFNVTGVPNGGCNLALRITAETGAEDTLSITC